MSKTVRLSTLKPRLQVARAPKQLSVATVATTGKSWRGWYNLKLWKDLRRQQLTRQPLCEMCLAHGKVEFAKVVDHRSPHRGNWELFKDPANHQSLCKQHHDSTKQKMEKRGHEGPIGGDALGMPLDPNHHWYA